MSNAQAERYTEDEIMLQDKFIDAYRDKTLGKIDNAITKYLELYKADRSNAAVAFELARAYAIKEDTESTKKYMLLSTKNDPDNIWYLEFQAEQFQKNDDIEGSLSTFKKLYSLRPDNTAYAYMLGDLYEASSNTADAINTYTQLESKIGISEETSRRKFESYRRVGDKKNAIVTLNKLCDTYPNNTRYLNNLASFYKEVGDDKNSEKIYKKVLSLDPNNADATIALAGDITKKGNESAYLLALKNVLRSPDVPIDMKIKELIPYVQRMSPDPKEADNISLLESIEDLGNAHPSEAKAFAIHGDVLMNLGMTDHAIVKYAKTLELNKSNFAVWEQYMFALDIEEAYESLEKVSADALDIYPNQAICYYFNGKANQHIGNKKAAADMFEEASIIGRKDVLLQSRISEAKSNSDSLFKRWAFMRGLDSTKSLSLEAFADEQSAQGNVDQALEYWKKALTTSGDKKRLEKKIRQAQPK